MVIIIIIYGYDIEKLKHKIKTVYDHSFVLFKVQLLMNNSYDMICVPS